MAIAVVTGASGFIGKHLCARLQRDGFEVRALSHAKHGFSDDRLKQAFESADVVYHLAGLAHQHKIADPQCYLDVNGRLPAMLAERAGSLGVSAFVWLSTIKVLGDVSQRPLRVGDPYQPDGIYAQSKVFAEQAMSGVDTSLRIATVRPPLVYGPGVGGNFLRLLSLAEKGWPAPLKGATAPRTMVGVANLTDLLVRLSQTGQGTFHVGDAQDLGISDLYSRLCRLLHSTERQFHVPVALVKALAGLTGRSALVSRLFDPLQVDWTQTQTDLAWQPPHTIDDELRRTVACYQQPA